MAITAFALLLSMTGAVPAPDSLVAPLWVDQHAEMELVIWPPAGVRLPVWYQVDWGDGQTTEWSGPVRSPTDVSRYHIYLEKGEYQVRVRCRDSLNNESDWGRSLPVIVGEPLLKWVFPTAASSVTSPTLDNAGNIYVADDTGFVYSVTPGGELRWVFQTRGPVFGSITISEDNVYVVSLDSSLYCLGTDGKRRWAVDLNDELYCGPAVGPDRMLYVGTSTGTLYAVTPQGRIRWRFRTGDEISSSPTVGPNGLVYVSSDKLYCLDNRGRKKWAFEAPGGEYFFAAAVPDHKGLVYVGNFDSHLYCIGPDGRMRWRASTEDESEIRSEVAFHPDGTLWFGSDADYGFRMKPGEPPELLFEAVDIVIATPAISDKGSAYFLPDDGTLYAFRKDGRLLMKADVASGDKDVYYTASPTLGPDGTLYVASWDGGLYAYRADGPPAKTIWPQYRGDAQHTGRVRK